jgi:hypothetical protein
MPERLQRVARGMAAFPGQEMPLERAATERAEEAERAAAQRVAAQVEWAVAARVERVVERVTVEKTRVVRVTVERTRGEPEWAERERVGKAARVE